MIRKSKYINLHKLVDPEYLLALDNQNGLRTISILFEFFQIFTDSFDKTLTFYLHAKVLESILDISAGKELSGRSNKTLDDLEVALGCLSIESKVHKVSAAAHIESWSLDAFVKEKLGEVL